MEGIEFLISRSGGDDLKKNRKRLEFSALLILATLLSGCAFDLAHVKYDPVKFEPNSAETRRFTLREDVALSNLPCGYNRTLKKDKQWASIGRIDKGEIYKPIGHFFTVECSNIFEAYLVLRDDQLYGFYLPVEKGFVNIKNHIKLPLRFNN